MPSRKNSAGIQANWPVVYIFLPSIYIKVFQKTKISNLVSAICCPLLYPIMQCSHKIWRRYLNSYRSLKKCDLFQIISAEINKWNKTMGFTLNYIYNVNEWNKWNETKRKERIRWLFFHDILLNRGFLKWTFWPAFNSTHIIPNFCTNSAYMTGKWGIMYTCTLITDPMA